MDFLIQLSCEFDISLDYLVLGRNGQQNIPTEEKARLKDDIEVLINQLEIFKTGL